MTTTKLSFEIHDITAEELLCDNVHFDDIPELLTAYEYFYPQHQIEVCCREVTIIDRVHYIPKDDFRHDWYNMLDDIIDNLY